MKNTLLIVVLLLGYLSSFGQSKSVESARVAFISQRINITPAQAEKFWPVYNEFNNKKADIRQAIRKLYGELSTASDQTDEKIKASIAQMSSLKQQEVALEKEYNNRYLLIITAKQLADLILAEREFQKILIKKVSEE